MKKQYINPETNIVVLIAQSQLMAGSDFTMPLETEEVSDETINFTQASRRKSLWDDDEE
ncbi:MAG: hypothetical protein IJ176_04265 [Prevotella sp.]|nr:hypothetical protein [Prevotella sp.]